MQELVDRFRDVLEARGYSEATCDAYVRCVRKLLRHTGKHGDEVTPEDVTAYLLWLRREAKLAPSTRVVYAAAARHLFRWMREDERLALRIPLTRVPRRLPTVLSGTQVKALLAAIPEPHHHAIATVCYAAGLRVTEACSLEVSHIDSRRGVIRLVGKGDKERVVPMSDALLRELRAYWRKARPKGPLLFPGRPPTRPLTRAAFRLALRRAAKRATLEVSPHTLRHSYATHLIEAGIDLRSLQLRMGHESIETTARYVHVARARHRELDSPLDLLGTRRGRPFG